MFRTRVTHFSITEDAVLPGYLSIAEFGENIMHVPFLHTAKLHKFDTVNWPQSFARKGLDYERFVLQPQTDPMLFEFEEHRAFVREGMAPDRVVFKRRVKFYSALQGDLIMCVKEELALPVKVLADDVVDFPDSLAKSLSRKFHTQKDWLKRATKLLTQQDHADFIAAVVMTWSKDSFVRTEILQCS